MLIFTTISWRFWVLLTFLLPGLGSAQDTLDWRAINTDNSVVEFDQVRTLWLESAQWDIPDRVALLEKLYHSAKVHQDDSLTIYYGEDLAILYGSIDSFTLAMEVLNEALAFTYSPSSTQLVYTALGILHHGIEDMETALDYYLQAFEAVKDLDDGQAAYPLLNMANVYREIEDYENATKYCQYAIEFGRKLRLAEKEYNLVFNNSYLLSCYYEQGQQRDAIATIDSIKFYMQALEQYPNQKYKDATFLGYYFISDYFLKVGQAREAQEHIGLAREYAQAFYLPELEVLEARRLVLMGNHGSALQKINASFPTDSTSTTEVLNLKAKCLTALGRHREALILLESQLEAQAQRSQRAQIRYAKFANARYETLRKNEEIKSLHNEKQIQSLTIQNQRYAMSVGLLCFTLLAGGAIFIWRQSKFRQQLSVQLQQQVALQTKDLKQANEELRMLNYVASHDIKEPIRNIGSITGLIRSRLPKDLRVSLQAYFDIVNNSTKQLYSLIEDVGRFLALSQDAQIEQEEVDLNEVVQNIKYALAQVLNEKNVLIETNHLPVIQSNTTILYILMKNLVENGIKFNFSETPRITIHYTQTESMHEVKVADNGIGIAKEYHEIIFKPTKRLNDRNNFEGSGIGLAIVKLVTEKLQGTVSISSEIDKGSTFSIKFPIITD